MIFQKNPQLLNTEFKQTPHQNKAMVLFDPITLELVGQLQINLKEDWKRQGSVLIRESSRKNMHSTALQDTQKLMQKKFRCLKKFLI